MSDHESTFDPDKSEPAPKWRKDFPIEWGSDNYVTRREFTKFLILISGATALGNGYFVLRKFQQNESNYPSVRVAAVADVPVQQVKLFRYPTEHDPALLIHVGPGHEEQDYVAYMQRCTHLTCPVLYSAEKNRIECPCHHGYFDVRTGAVLAGPPPRPLPRIKLRIENGEIWAQGFETPERGEGTEPGGNTGGGSHA